MNPPRVPGSSNPAGQRARSQRPPSVGTLRQDKDGWYDVEPEPLSASSARPPSNLRPSTSAPLRPSSSASLRPPSSTAIRSSKSGPIRPSSSVAMRPPSSASVRPGSSASMRPASSASMRPASSLSVRPPSSASTMRPGTSASVRRPVSRLSQRPPTRQSSRILPLCETLVTQITGFTAADQEVYQAAVDYTSKNLDSTVRPSASTDYATIDRVMKGYLL